MIRFIVVSHTCSGFISPRRCSAASTPLRRLPPARDCRFVEFAHSDTNYCSPGQGRRCSSRSAREPVEAGSAFKGADIAALTYPEGDTEAMLAQTRRA
jgi:hypothetical protein